MSELLLPAYGERSLGDVVPAVARGLGLDPSVAGQPPSDLVLPDAPAYVVFLIDGLGAELLRRYAHAAPYLTSLMRGATIGTSGVPSTTATSLTSLGTGLVPGAHGLIGYTARMPGTDKLINHLKWDASIDPHVWQPHPTAFARLTRAGVNVTVVNKRSFEGSGLTRAAHRGAEFVGADLVGERIAAMVTAGRHAPSLTYVYDSDLDWTGHRFGVASTQWLQQLAMVDAEAEQMREALAPSVRFVIVADHGMVDSALSSRVDVDEVPELRDGVDLLGGEARFRHLYCAPGAVDSVVSTWSETLGSRALVVTRDDAVARGWFGEVADSVLPRVGDVMVACRGDAAVVSSVDFSYETQLIGMHGSLTPDEMLIPILVD
ncbi:alkaline phosphatase family protein [Nocardioides piscis]|uniref:Alkaline phosphatase family protein n=1 Tax=Nocardioides piscis TaxID=2714938 RepID=A0A6G7YHF2_9ACTN|nr:nucleotide pyrophosphatase/phosphodiesterase family protein [Nocardioides piscis]QIK76324.1 alkaline phosphatase family protein [Nocardioides piscis]